MKGKKLLVIFLSVIIFAASVVLGIASVYRISAVQITPITYSKAAEAEVEELQGRMLQAYEKQSFFSVDSKPAEEIMAEFPYFRMTSFEKSAPNRIIIKVVEDEEVYAMALDETGESYYVLGLEGVVLGIRETYVNRLDGADNLLIKGLSVQGEKGQIVTGSDVIAPLFAFCKKASECLDGIRRNVTLVEVLRPTSSEREVIVRLTMAEGVKIYVGNIAVMTQGKAEQAMQLYVSLDDQERMTGRIAVSDNNGQLVIGYAKDDEFGF